MVDVLYVHNPDGSYLYFPQTERGWYRFHGAFWSCLQISGGYLLKHTSPRHFKGEHLTFAIADSFAEIRRNMERLKAEAVPKCSRSNMDLYRCLRTSVRCPEECSHHAEWVGPDKD